MQKRLAQAADRACCPAHLQELRLARTPVSTFLHQGVEECAAEDFLRGWCSPQTIALAPKANDT